MSWVLECPFLVWRYNYLLRRGQPMAFFALAAVAGTGLGPVIAGMIEADPHLEWRWIQWIHVMLVSRNISRVAH
jgi:MFS family permease